MTTKKVSRSIKSKYHSGPNEVPGFEVNWSIWAYDFGLGRSQSTFRNLRCTLYAYFSKIPTELDPEQVYDYLFYLQKIQNTLQTYFLNTVWPSISA
jgi:hypothetical protein